MHTMYIRMAATAVKAKKALTEDVNVRMRTFTCKRSDIAPKAKEALLALTDDVEV